MGKFVFWVGLAALAWMAWKLASVILRKSAAERQKRADRDAAQHRGSSQSRSSAPEVAEPMVQCAHCGLYLPMRESVSHEGRSYCSPDHRDAARRR